jgi:hypothetical protein
MSVCEAVWKRRKSMVSVTRETLSANLGALLLIGMVLKVPKLVCSSL